MTEFMPPHALLAEIETLQDEVLRQLDELNARIERTLAEFGGAPEKQAVPALAHGTVVRRSAA